MRCVLPLLSICMHAISFLLQNCQLIALDLNDAHLFLFHPIHLDMEFIIYLFIFLWEASSKIISLDYCVWEVIWKLICHLKLNFVLPTMHLDQLNLQLDFISKLCKGSTLLSHKILLITAIGWHNQKCLLWYLMMLNLCT